MKKLFRIALPLMVLALATNVSADAVYFGGASTSDLTVTYLGNLVGVYDPGNDNGANSILETPEFIAMFGSGWSTLAKVEGPDWGIDPTLGLTLSGQGTRSGTWEVSPTAWDGYAQGTILGILKAGTIAAAYELDLRYTSGTWNIDNDVWRSVNAGGGYTYPSLSHFSILTNNPVVPVPGAVWLGAIGLSVVGVKLRKRA